MAAFLYARRFDGYIESKEVIRKLSKDFHGNLSDAEIMRLTGLARNTYYKYKRDLREEQKEAAAIEFTQ